VEYATEQTAFGVFSGRLDLTYLDSHKQSPAPDLPAVERIGTYSVEVGTLAKYRWNGRLNWTLDNVDLSTGIRYVDDITNEGSLLVNGERLQTDDYLQADLLVDYLFDDSGITISLGVENIFDEMPPWLEGNYFNGFDEGSFHSRGRFFYTRIEKLF
jgi:outer membrane receptor protein involved in Fe transport